MTQFLFWMEGICVTVMLERDKATRVPLRSCRLSIEKCVANAKCLVYRRRLALFLPSRLFSERAKRRELDTRRRRWLTLATPRAPIREGPRFERARRTSAQRRH